MNFDLFAFGNLSLDIIQTPKNEYTMVGGAILYAAWAAHQLGRSIGVLTKTSEEDKYMLDEFPPDKINGFGSTKIFWKASGETTAIRNFYNTDSKETRICTNNGQADPYSVNDFPDFDAKVIQYSGLLRGEIDSSIIEFLSKKAPLAIDAQGLTRQVFEDKSMEFQMWDNLEKDMTHITYFKADAAEARYLTGVDTGSHDGRVKAGEKFIEMGAKEVIISHNQELLCVTGSGSYSYPFKNSNLNGRTGRGDTCFSTYITERLDKSESDALLFAAALTSLKMEIPGPFKKTREDVEAFIAEGYGGIKN